MDPYSRRFAWGYIRAQKPGRTIVITTHFMDGACCVRARARTLALQPLDAPPACRLQRRTC